MLFWILVFLVLFIAFGGGVFVSPWFLVILLLLAAIYSSPLR